MNAIRRLLDTETSMSGHKAGREEERIRNRIAALQAEQLALEQQLTDLFRVRPPTSTARGAIAVGVTNDSNARDKIALFRRLFAGREDVFPVRWENLKTKHSGYAPACANEWVKGVCAKPQVKCGECPNQAFVPVSDEVIGNHLRGADPTRRANADFIAGVYPLLPDETCWFLAADFDGDEWAADALAYIETCSAKGVPASLERSRSGNGGHVWIFFSEPIRSRDARKLGSLIITEAMERRPEIGFRSYDRLFPSQDTMPSGGFGNLIALPLQRRSREQGNSVFVDENLQPHADQWAFLSSLDRMSADAVSNLIESAEVNGHIIGVRMPVEDENADEPWRLTPSRRHDSAPIPGALPSHATIVLADDLYIDRTELPPAIVARIVRLAAFQNPEFYRAQAMRLSTFGKPRVISCAALHLRHVALPRGCLDEAIELLRSCRIDAIVDDRRDRGTPLPIRFLGALRQEQQAAFEALAKHDFGVLAATTAFGKTVVAAALIAHRKCNTLILVHRRELLTQWTERLKTFLSVESDDIGAIGGGRRKPTRHIDIALIQSLVRNGEVSDLISGYGQLVVDECHHLSAASFELVARRSNVYYVLGLSATVARKDGHHPIIFMQCGPVRYRASANSHAAQRSFEHQVSVRQTTFHLPPEMTDDRLTMAALYAALGRDEARNALIFDDVLTALEAGRSPLVLTERRHHLEMLRDRFKKFTRNLIVMHGGMGAGARRAADEALRSSNGEERLIIATGRYLGEGFDDPRLDTLFLTMPISWKGTLTQYVGRLHREHQGKREVMVYDYVDRAIPVLARMAAKRQAGYRALGYRLQ